jgi:hypothetical protein
MIPHLHLYAETAGLEVKYSTTEVYSYFPPFTEPGKAFVQFHRCLHTFQNIVDAARQVHHGISGRVRGCHSSPH